VTGRLFGKASKGRGRLKDNNIYKGKESENTSVFARFSFQNALIQSGMSNKKGRWKPALVHPKKLLE
jgi:hypothetical protein